MEAQNFYDAVSDRADVSEAESEEATGSVLATLGERVTDGVAEDLAAELPDQVGDELADAPGEAGSFDLDEFLARVADREDVTLGKARDHARAVLGTVNEAASDDVLAAVREQLPDEFALVYEPGDQVDEAEFLEEVARTSDEQLSDDAAEDAATATLRTLGKRLSEGEASDLATYLPPALGDALLANAPQTPPDFSADEFVARVAEQLDVDEDTAERRATAVLDTVADTAANREVDAAQSQLPTEYDRLFAAGV